MEKKPWEEKVVDDNDMTFSRKTKSSVISTPILTALLSVFFAIVVVVLFVVFYTSNSGSDKKAETSHFYESSSSTSTVSSVAPSESQTTESSSSATKTGDTITVLAGEGAAAIAARAGISVEKLYELNPDHMTLGYWYANPGDEVHIN